MSKHTLAAAGAEVRLIDLHLSPTRGSLREQEKRRRRLARVQGGVLVVGLDLARRKQAVSFAHAGQSLGRRRVECAPERLAEVLQPLLRHLGGEHALERVLIGMEPAGHYWQLAAEGFEAAGLEYVLVHTLSVKRERETAHYTPEKTDPRDADLVCALVENGRFTEAQLPVCAKRAAMDVLAREYLLLRRQSAAEVARLKCFWGRLLPELGELLKEPDGVTGLAISRALLPFSELAALSADEWVARVAAQTEGRIVRRVATALLARMKAAHADAHRRSGEGIPLRIRMAAERRSALEAQKGAIAERLLAHYAELEESVLVDSIPGSSVLYNAIVLGLAGDLRAYDCGRAVVKLAGSEVNEYGSGEWRGRSRISHRGRAPLRTAAYQQAKLLASANPVFRARYTRLLARLEKRQAYVAVANAYLRTAHALVSRGEPWNEEAAARRC